MGSTRCIDSLDALVALCGAGAIVQVVATARDRAAYPAPGELVDVGGYRLHIHCIGEGNPTVILEAGQANASPIWSWVQPGVAATTRVCAYDRAGIGWSDPGSSPRDAQQIARELHTLLARAKIDGPYVLVGHSAGGLYTRVYAATYPGDVVGMVLVDAEHPEQWTSTPEGPKQYQTIAWSNRFGSLFAPIGVLRAFNFFPLSQDMPPQQAAEYKAFTDTTQFIRINAAEFAATPATDTEVQQAGSLGCLPLVVLTATDHDFPPALAADLEQLHMEMQDQLAALSSNSIHRVVSGTTHASLLIKQHDAETTIDAISQVVEAVRSGKPLTGNRVRDTSSH